jgi:4-hydroxy-tetrahydrodipicolinate reductase
MAVDIIVIGVLGRMGRQIASAVLADRDTRLCGCTEAATHELVGKKLGPQIGEDGIDITVSASIDTLPVETSVIIDFSAPEATCELLEKVSNRNARVVIGTTGCSNEQNTCINKVSKQCAILYSPNMSVGVNLLFYLTQIAAEKLGEGFDVEIVEAHHRMKADAPSGTAGRLGEIVARARGLSYNNEVRHGRQGRIGKRTDREIGMHAVRAGDIVGDHTVVFAGQGERMELKHMAHSRMTFAQGAVLGAKWLHSQSAGLYSMRDVLGF